MDSQFTPTREDLYHVQMDVKHVQAVQINHAERLLRLEKRQADDAALKSVWGNGSPFPSVLSGTPQQGPVQHHPTDVFDDFDDEQSHNLLGSLQLEAEEEPVRRGASRANSVRFDVSALQGSNWNVGSRNSGDFGPVRPSSGIGSHPMTERSLSHKSDGRHSSAGHSVHSMHSGRNSSLGLDTNFIIGGQDDDSPLDTPDPPPGLFVLGSVPSIIRCWLTTNFSHNALLYADICSGSQKSVLDYSLVKELGLTEQIEKTSAGHHIRLPVYLPEAVITQPTSRSNSPAPQLPTLSADFEIVGLNQRNTPERKQGIRIILGSDILRVHNADIFFSQNLMTLYGDDRSKLSVPFVRPEDDNLFKNLCTSNIPPEKNELKATAAPFTPVVTKIKIGATETAVPKSVSPVRQEVVKAKQADQAAAANSAQPESPFTPVSMSESSTLDRVTGASENTSTVPNHSGLEKSQNAEQTHGADGSSPVAPPESNRRDSSVGIWGSWRHGTVNGGETGREAESTSGYQRAARGGRSMKVLKPSSKSVSSIAVPSSRSVSSAARPGAAYDTPPAPRSAVEMRRKSQVENPPLKWESKRTSSEEHKPGGVGRTVVASIPRNENPVGGASAFSWMKAASKKATTTAE
ncbi:hypothetical protein HYALB_00012831 [Hymenoscyphus albidus]|uniref:Ubiquitin carboxyl-terminal hydrolase 19 n=1 Tax=Hymenoscyphus albidus TaxID=595503 RepID=A0A9N9LS05_9HELO|nr:hypothetical protein HYALB_00012831 [Hymenoscyphus albidus]